MLPKFRDIEFAPTAVSIRSNGSRVPLPRDVAFYLLASITVSFLAGSSAPTPLYSIYQQQWGFSPIMLTVIFGIYAIAVLLALLFTGRLSDHLGRRPVLIAATAAQTLTMILFAMADGIASLMLARIIQGLATGAAVAAVGAGMIDLNKTRGAVANAVAPAFGTATGGILAGFMVQYLPAPTHLVYAFLGMVFVLQGIGVYRMAETTTPQRGALAALRPQFRLPAAVREPLLLAVPVLIAVWGLAGFYASLGPTLVRSMLGTNSVLVGGLALFALAASGGIAILALQHREPRLIMSIGTAALALGVGIAIGSLPSHSLTLFFVGSCIAGVGFGCGFQGAVRSIVPLASPNERAGVLSIVFIVSYLSLGVPAIAAGALLARHGDILGTAQEFGGVIMGLALMALLASLLRQLTRTSAAIRI